MKIYNYYVFIALFLTVFSSCSQSHDENTVVIALKGTEVETDPDYIGVFRPEIVGKRIISKLINSQYNAYIGQVYEDSIITESIILKKGQGPYEFGDVAVHGYSDSILSVLNCNGGRPISFDKIPIESLLSDDNHQWERYSLNGLQGFRGGDISFVSLSDSTVLFNSGRFESGAIFSIFNYKSGKLTELNWRPIDGFNGSPIVKQGVYVDNSFLWKNDDKLFYLCGNGQYGFIFTVKDGDLNIISELFSNYPDYWDADDGINYLQKFKGPSYVACVNSKNIYILEKDSDNEGNVVNDERKSRPFGKKVHVYDWEGNLIKDYELDKYLMYIMVSEANTSLYGLSIDRNTMEDKIFRYDLK